MKHVRSCWMVSVLALLAGCGPSLVNASFPLTLQEARKDLKRMADEPMALQRPVLVLGGWVDPGLASDHIRRLMARISPETPMVCVTFLGAGSFQACREKVLNKVQQALPSPDPLWTTEVDVIAFSMGGLVARHAAAGPDPGQGPSRRLKIARLFTICAPHRGARSGNLGFWDPLAAQMKPGSPFLARLDRELKESPLEIYSYTRLGDWVVGAENSAPVGSNPWWVDPSALDDGHLGAFRDPRILADIARRLRGQTPHATEPPAPLPRKDGIKK